MTETTPTRMSETGLDMLRKHESCVLHAYDDLDPSWPRKAVQPGDEVKGTLTIGYGHTGDDVRPGMCITTYQAEELLREDLSRFEDGVRRMLDERMVHVLQHEFDALVSFAFNVGLGNFQSSTLLRKLSAGERFAAAAEFPKWVFSKGQRLRGLEKRRADERQMFLGIGD